MASDEKPIVVVKASLAKILRNPEHLAIYQDRVNIVNRLVTAAYVFARYIFVHAYEEDENDENDNDAFNADVFMTDAFFFELLRSLQTRTEMLCRLESSCFLVFSKLFGSPLFFSVPGESSICHSDHRSNFRVGYPLIPRQISFILQSNASFLVGFTQIRYRPRVLVAWRSRCLLAAKLPSLHGNRRG